MKEEKAEAIRNKVLHCPMTPTNRMQTFWRSLPIPRGWRDRDIHNHRTTIAIVRTPQLLRLRYIISYEAFQVDHVW